MLPSTGFLAMNGYNRDGGGMNRCGDIDVVHVAGARRFV
jgi:hypothetical protein